MTAYIVEAAGRRIAVINAGSMREAEEHADTLGFRTTIMSLERNGSPLWDGKVKLVIRKASAPERKKWETDTDAQLTCVAPIE
jgi:hypothetical protein